MKYVNKASILVVTMLGLVGCQHFKEDYSLSFPNTVHINGKAMPIKNIFIKYPFKIRHDDSKLFILDLHATGSYCHEFSYPEMTYRGSYFKRGESPSEVLDIENIRMDKKRNLWGLDADKKQLVKISPGNAPQQEITILDDDLIRPLDFDLLNDSTFIIPDYSGSSRLCIVNNKGKIVKRLFEIPSVRNSKISMDQNMILAQAWRPFISFNRHNQVIAAVTQLGEFLEIYNLEKNKVVKIIGGRESEPKFAVSGASMIPTGIMGYSDVYVGEYFIYAIFWGTSFDSIKKNPNIQEGGNQIHVFDLEGNPVKKNILDRNIVGFQVDENDKRLICTDVNSDEVLVEYFIN